MKKIIKNQTRKQFLLENQTSDNYTKTLRNLKMHKKILTPYPLMTMKEKYAYNDIHKIGYLDIETSSLQGNYGFMLSWCIYVRDVKTGTTELRGDFITEKDFEIAKKGTKKRGKWAPNANLIDARILKSLMSSIGDCDLLIGHWFIGKFRHDIPYTRTRMAINKISGFPKHKMIRYGDTQKWVSLLHRLSSNGLAVAGDAYGITTKKSPITTEHWNNARTFGTKADVEYIYTHNIKDVILTYKLHKHVEEYVPIAATYC